MTPRLIRVVAAVVSRGHRLLVCQRPYGKRHGGLWEFPGGKCEAGESDLAATRRELHEELGVDLVDVGDSEFVIHDSGSLYLIAFTPVRISGEPTPLEHLSLCWGCPNELVNLQLAPSDRRYVEFLIARQ